MSTTTAKRAMVWPPAYSQLDDEKRSEVASARPKMISRLSLAMRTSVLVGILCPPILSIAYLSDRNHLVHRFPCIFSFIVLGQNAVISGHAFYIGSIGG